MAEFEQPIRIYWQDTDAGGIVYHANYLNFFERARTEWLRSLGFSQQRLSEESGGMFVVVKMTIKYLQPARLDDELMITARLQETARASMVFGQQAWRLRTESPSRELLCTGQVRVGWIDALRMKPARIPPDILEKMQS